MTDARKFYVYAHRSLSGDIFYIGKGRGKRAWGRYHRSLRWKRHAAKHGLKVNIIKDGMSEPCAFTLEKIIIGLIGIENLTNMTNGGEGSSGRIPSAKQREKCSVSNKGRVPARKTLLAAMKKNRKPVGTTCGLVFGSVTEAAKFVCIDGNITAAKSSISACCRGYRVSQCYGYEFRFIVNGVLQDSGFRKKVRGHPVKTSCGMVFSSGASAAKWLRSNGSPRAITSNIFQCCKGNVKTAYGYKWEYA